MSEGVPIQNIHTSQYLLNKRAVVSPTEEEALLLADEPMADFSIAFPGLTP